MRQVVGILGPGAVGGVFSVRLQNAGHHTIVVAPPETVGMVALAGFTVEVDGDVLASRPEVRERLERPVKLLLVTVKAHQLGEALERVDPGVVEHGVVLPLLNGIEHLEPLREHFGPRVAAGSISHFEAYRVGRVQIVQTGARSIVTMASDDLTAEDLAEASAILQSAGFEVRLEESEKEVLWRKAARLAVLSAATALTRRSVGSLRDDPEWRPRLEAAVAEACAVAAADGVKLIPSSQWTVIAALDHDFTTSTARDVLAGRPTELDAIAGSVLRAADRLGVPCPVLSELVSEASMA
jgi:2-dehydropantoate 2-reductase